MIDTSQLKKKQMIIYNNPSKIIQYKWINNLQIIKNTDYKKKKLNFS